MTTETERLVVRMEGNVVRFEEAMAKANRAAYGSAAKIEKRLGDMNRNVNRSFADVAKGSVGGVLGGLGVSALLGFAVAAERAASEAEELESAIGFSFGRNAKAIDDWADQTGDALGRSSTELKKAAFEFQNLFGQQLPLDQATEMSKRFAILVQDLSSFRNVSEDIVQQNLLSGLVGEAEPVRKFGIFLNEANVKAKALKMGLADANGEVSEQNKLLARAAIMVESTTIAHGDLARTLDSTTNRKRAAASATKELTEELGKGMQPIVRDLAGLWDKLATAISGAVKRMREAREEMHGPAGQAKDLERTIAAREERIRKARSGTYLEAASTGMPGLAAMDPVKREAYAKRLEAEQAVAKAQLETAKAAAAKAAAGSPAVTEPPKPAEAPPVDPKDAQRAAKDALDRARRSEDLIAKADADLFAAKSEMAVSAAERRDIALEALKRDQEARKRELDRMEADKDIDADKRKEIEAAEEAVRLQRETNIRRRAAQEIEEEELRARQIVADVTGEMLSVMASQAKTAKERRDIELELLKMHQQERRLMLDRLAADETRTQAERDAAALALKKLPALEEAERNGVKRDTAGPLETYARGQDPAERAEEFERIAVKGLDALNQGLVDAMMHAEDLGDVARNVFRQIAADLLSQLLRQGVTQPLAQAVMSFGGFRAGGGPVSPGKAYVVGEHRPELFVPNAAGRIVPRVPTGPGGRATLISQTVQINAQGSILSSEVFARMEQMKREAVSAAVGRSADMQRRAGPGLLAQYQKLQG